MKKIYLDNAATTPIDERVLEVMIPLLKNNYGNPSSIHLFGREARVIVDESRDRIAKLIGASAGEIFFVSCGTEANNFALKGVAQRMIRNGKDHIITCKTEHHSVLETCDYLGHTGFKITFLGVDGYGRINPDDVQKVITKNTGLISVMHVNNEIGTIQPISEIAKITRENSITLHTDAVQSFGKLPLNVNQLGVDMLSLSAHKIYGPKGIGAIFIRSGIDIEKLLHGGGQERGRRAGTENIALISGFTKAAELIYADRETETVRLQNLKNKLKTLLIEKYPFIKVNGHPTESLPNILNVSFDSKEINLDGDILVVNLDIAGIAVSNGSACTSGSVEPSHVLMAMGIDRQTAMKSIRFSFGRTTTYDDIDKTVNVLDKIIDRSVKRSS